MTSIMAGSAYALHGLLGLLAWNWFFADATGLPHGTIMQALVVTLFLSALHPPEGTVEARRSSIRTSLTCWHWHSRSVTGGWPTTLGGLRRTASCTRSSTW